MDHTKLVFESDPTAPGRVSVDIRSLTKDAVQAEIDRLINIVDERGGWAEFDWPKRDYGGFHATGKLFVDPTVPL